MDDFRREPSTRPFQRYPLRRMGPAFACFRRDDRYARRQISCGGPRNDEEREPRLPSSLIPDRDLRSEIKSVIDDLWYKNAVIYCLSVGTYMDSNGDGIGDFRGLLRRLDYLHGLGITAIWLMPFQTSPHKDDGYDVADYYNADARYGTLGDFVEFTHGAKQRGIRVIIDLVVNHTSNEHPWFKEARKDPQS